MRIPQRKKKLTCDGRVDVCDQTVIRFYIQYYSSITLEPSLRQWMEMDLEQKVKLEIG